MYAELKKANQQWVDEIQKAENEKAFKGIWEKMKEKAFISYKVNPSDIDENVEEFSQLSLEDQKRFLIEVLDKNVLYVNYSEIDDADFEVSEEDKKLNGGEMDIDIPVVRRLEIVHFVHTNSLPGYLNVSIKEVFDRRLVQKVISCFPDNVTAVHKKDEVFKQLASSPFEFDIDTSDSTIENQLLKLIHGEDYLLNSEEGEIGKGIKSQTNIGKDQNGDDDLQVDLF